MDIIEQALNTMLETQEGRVDLKTMPAAFFDYFEVTEAEMAA